MSLELVKEIKQAEEKAGSIIHDAHLSARQTLKDAESRASEILARLAAEAENEAGDIIARAKEDARSQAEPLARDKQAEIIRLKETAASRLPEAVALLTDKVVKTDADH